MAAIDDLISQVEDKALRERLREEAARLTKEKKFGLVFEEHLPELTPIYEAKIKRGSEVPRRDNVAKALGLAKFAEKHPYLFDRVQLIRKQKGADGKEHFNRLDVGNDAVRKKVLAVSNDTQLNQLFESEGKVQG
ncbi:MAG: hypothetical protein KJ069_28915 [Anaerolineae bacterium]|nr:hypothetical protein [Anaerolineae bacterium]